MIAVYVLELHVLACWDRPRAVIPSAEPSVQTSPFSQLLSEMTLGFIFIK